MKNVLKIGMYCFLFADSSKASKAFQLLSEAVQVDDDYETGTGAVIYRLYGENDREPATVRLEIIKDSQLRMPRPERATARPRTNGHHRRDLELVAPTQRLMLPASAGES